MSKASVSRLAPGVEWSELRFSRRSLRRGNSKRAGPCSGKRELSQFSRPERTQSLRHEGPRVVHSRPVKQIPGGKGASWQGTSVTCMQGRTSGSVFTDGAEMIPDGGG
jgi:hypothetical protein